MHTLDLLRSGELSGVTTLSLSCELDSFPEEIFGLAETLEVLNLSGNRLSTLPDDFGCLQKLRILFLSENQFTSLPAVLAECPNLTMIGFKSNRISNIPENALPKNVQWLILTDNQIETLPESMGDLSKLQKCMLAGNKIAELPKSMALCRSLELLRLSANALESLPEWLFTLPRLSWFACAGNPCVNITELETQILPEVSWCDITLHEELGKGASGVISRASLSQEEMYYAVKIFKGAVTSDGYPEDEMAACIAAGEHENLTKLHTRFTAHPEGKEGLVFTLIPPSYRNLGSPPDFDSCTRDTYEEHTAFSLNEVLRIAREMTSVMSHLHSQKICHGDLYAHNILIDEDHTLFSDFGAATRYDKIEGIESHAFERLEVRAFAALLEDLLTHVIYEVSAENGAIIEKLEILKEACMQENVRQRPLFSSLYTTLVTLH